ncbi:TPR domain protein, putative component of TonB system [Imhoffiella purpurea]|uniref:protein O-GlcNAc transferase n=1 Tax=Imhoffiella purpurea TaxID=1249627 RepID=W9V456_9GAMM|nr:TPR domain protein, putative component of TonB system [Imhoffiella purpurea]
MLEVERGRMEEGLGHLRRALESAPETGDYWQSFAEGLLLAGRAQDAASVIEQAMAAGLRTQAAIELQMRIQAQILAGSGQSHERDRILERLAMGRFSEAEDLARQFSAREPGDAFGWKVLGTLLVRSERIDEAISVLQRARTLDPQDGETLNSLARAHQSLGAMAEAVDLYRAALTRQPESAEIWNNLGMALKELGRLDGALVSVDQALKLHPGYVKAHNNRGALLAESGRLDEALECFERALAIDSEHTGSYKGRGAVLLRLGRMDEAILSYLQALTLQPNDVDGLTTLGVALNDMGRFEEASDCFERALAVDPQSVAAYSNRGMSMFRLGHLDLAMAYYDQALAIQPSAIEPLNNRAILLHHLGRMDEALASVDKSLAEKPDFAMALNNRANVLKDLARFDEAIADYRRAIAIKPDFSIAYSNLLFVLNYHPAKSAEDIFSAYQDYDRRYGEPHRGSWRSHRNDPDPQRRLRIGYVSADFRGHSAYYFLKPLFAQHDKSLVELTAYSQVMREDHITAELREHVDHWVSTLGMSDEALAERIRADRIDILVDLAGHTGGNRLGVFARRPAPVSVSWMGYGYTTGLKSIDYFLTDSVMAPAGSEHLFAEAPWRLDAPSIAYRPSDDMGMVGSLPALDRGFITFGTLSRSVRINDRVIRVWSIILNQVGGSRLVIDSKDFVTPSAQAAMAARFAAHGIGPDRLDIGYHSPPWDLLRSMDIALDCFPHNSGTTLIESLYMGVPFVTLADRPSVGRIGSMMLVGAGHGEWIAENENDYVGKAVALANDLERLAEIRATLREELDSGPLRDEVGFARRVEQAYRQMWGRWCTSESDPDADAVDETDRH